MEMLNNEYYFTNEKDRIYSVMWDYLFLMIFFIILYIILRLLDYNYPFNYNYFYFANFVYPIYSSIMTKWGTFGKQIQGIAIVDKNGYRIGYFRNFFRSLFFSISVISIIILIISTIMLFKSRKSRTLHDILFKTYVVDLKST